MRGVFWRIRHPDLPAKCAQRIRHNRRTGIRGWGGDQQIRHSVWTLRSCHDRQSVLSTSREEYATMVAILRPAVKSGTLRADRAACFPCQYSPYRPIPRYAVDLKVQAIARKKRRMTLAEPIRRGKISLPIAWGGGFKIPQEPDVCFACHRSSTGPASHRRRSPDARLVPRSGRRNAVSSPRTKDPSPVLRRGV